MMRIPAVRTLFWLMLAGVAGVAGCGFGRADPEDAPAEATGRGSLAEPPSRLCTTGQSLACACTDGRSGAQVCQADGTLAPCQCTGPMPAAPAGDLPVAAAPPATATGLCRQLQTCCTELAATPELHGLEAMCQTYLSITPLLPATPDKDGFNVDTACAAGLAQVNLGIAGKINGTTIPYPSGCGGIKP